MKGISGDLFAYTSTRHAFSMIVQVEGIKGLYKGMWPNLLKVTPDSIIGTLTFMLMYARFTRVFEYSQHKHTHKRKKMLKPRPVHIYFSYGYVYAYAYAYASVNQP